MSKERVKDSSPHSAFMDRKFEILKPAGVVDKLLNREVPREQFVADLVRLITTERWSDEELEMIYAAARQKARSKVCFVCGELKPVFGATWLWPDGDMSKPKKFKCADCQGKL